MNDLSTNYKFILEPSDWTTSSHLTTEENDYLKIWVKFKNKQLTFDKAVELFFKNGTTPKWADCNVYYSTADLTVVKIFFSRQFRDDKEIYYLERGTGPFKAVVAIPFDYSENREKFDVNWKKNWDDRKQKGLWTKIKRLISQHILRGNNFKFLNTAYHLNALPNGQTELILSSTYELTTYINSYASFCGDQLLTYFQERLLKVIKTRCDIK